MRTKLTLLSLTILALVAAPTLGLACEGQKSADGTATASCGSHTDTDAASCCGGAPMAGSNLAKAAKNGCSSSMSALIEMAKKSDDEKVVMLANNAAGGCGHSKDELITLAMQWDDPAAAEASDAPTMAELAKMAEHGCAQSKAALIAMAKESDNKEAAQLAVRAEGGCEHSQQALIAMAQESDATAKDDTAAN